MDQKPARTVPPGAPVALDERDISFTFMRSSGPGGQNVNKVSTAVQARYNPAGVRPLAHDVRIRLLTLAGRRATREGLIVMAGQRFRSQERNRQDVLERLTDLVRRAAYPPSSRRPSSPTRASIHRRLDKKGRRSEIKRQRRKDGRRGVGEE